MLKEKLLEDLKVSMREKNVVRKNTVQMVRAAILKIEKDTGKEVDDSVYAIHFADNGIELINVETDDEIRKKWFIDRAMTERNQDLENALKHWDYISVAGEKYVKPYRKDADMVLNGNANLKYFAQILEYIHTITNNFQ